MKLNKSQSLDYLVLVVLLLVGLVGFLIFAHQPMAQVAIVGLTGAGYVSWGVWHHLRHGNLYWQVLLEYVLIAGLVWVMTASLLL